jgi:hypothetical protein
LNIGLRPVKFKIIADWLYRTKTTFVFIA